MSQPDEQGRIDAGKRVICHHAQPAVKMFKFANRVRLGNVEQPKQQESQRDAQPGRRKGNRHQGDELPANFIHDNLTGVVNAGGFTDAARSPHAQWETDDAQGHH